MRIVDSGRPTVTPWLVAGALLLGFAVTGAPPQPLLAQSSGQVGEWRTLPYLMPINPVHLALTHDGKVLIVAGSGNVATETNYQAAVWDPVAGTILTQPLAWDMFCNAMSVLPDGRVFVNGGNLKYDPFFGEPRNAAFDPATGTFTDLDNMAHGRWYPTVTTLGDGRVMTFSGLMETGGTNTTVEIYTPGSGWSPEYPSGWTPPLYPRMHLSPDGRVFYSGSGRTSRFFNPTTKAWTLGPTTNYAGTRSYGTSVLLPLRPADSYRPRVIIFGGGDPATATTEIVDLSAATPQWQYGPPMSQPRIQMNGTILPNGRVLAVGGSTYDEDANSKSLNADLFDPVTNTFSSAGANRYARLYHSGSLLLPDATVMLVGGNPVRGSYEGHIEIYSPAYLFNGNGTPAARPTITGLTPDVVGYGQTLQVQVPTASTIASVVLVRPGAQTHAFDMEQRLVGLNFTIGAGVLNVTAPPNGNLAPPGYYMLFVLDSAGVPSVASFVRLSASGSGPPDTTPPTVAMSSPAAGASVSGAVTVTASASDDVGVTSVQFQLDGVDAGPADTTAPFTWSWTTTATSNGSHTLTARAHDAAGHATLSAGVSVTVANAAGGTRTLGYTAVGTTIDSGAAGHINAWRFVMPNETGTAASVSVYVPTPISAAPNNQFQVAVYSDQSGAPGALLVASASQALVGNAWNLAPIATTALQPNTAYWLAYNTNAASATTNNVAIEPGTANQMRWRTQTFGAWPASFGPPAGSAPFQGSIYVTYTVASTAPRLTFTAPTPGSTVPPGAVTVTYTVTGDAAAAGVDHVHYQIDGGADLMDPPPIDGTFVATLATGAHTLTGFLVRADHSKIPDSDATPLQFTVSAAAQLVFTQPAAGSTVPAGPVTVNYIVTGDAAAAGVNHVHYQIDGGADIMDPPPIDGTFVVATLATGAHTLTGFLVLADHTKIPGTDASPLSFIVAPPPDTTAPTVAISSPAAGASVSGTVTVTASASDDVGVTSVQFQLDGVDAGPADTTAPFTWSWNTTGSANGVHTVSARARDAAGNATLSAPVSVTVANATFSISASPTTRTIPRNGATTYTVTVPPGQGFSGSIALSISGLPKFATGKFNPSVIVNDGASTLSVSTKGNVAAGSYTLRISGTSGSIVRFVDVTLIVQ